MAAGEPKPRFFELRIVVFFRHGHGLDKEMRNNAAACIGRSGRREEACDRDAQAAGGYVTG